MAEEIQSQQEQACVYVGSTLQGILMARQERRGHK